MAYRRRQGIARASTFKEEIHHPIENDGVSSSSSSLAAKAIRASDALRESSFSLDRHRSKEFVAYENAPESMSNSKTGFWGVLAQKAKAILEDDLEKSSPQTSSSFFSNTIHDQSRDQPYDSNANIKNTENQKFRKGLDKITTSLNHLGDTFEKAFEEGRTMVENKTADIIQETRKLQNKRQGNNPEAHARAENYLNDSNPWHQSPATPTQPQTQTNYDTQLKASRDVAMATAAKAKLLLRELKTVKADLAFAKERSSQLEEENKILRENRDKGDHRDDEDLIRLQLETLLAEKSRLANENSIFARENRFLREIVEYHQLTMQDVVYLDECSEEVTEVYPVTGQTGLSRALSTSLTPTTSEDIISTEAPLEVEIENDSLENRSREIEKVVEEDTDGPLESSK